MKNKPWVVLLVLVLGLVFVSCSDGEEPIEEPIKEHIEEPTEETHQHTYDSTWSTDENNHWHAANCGHDLIKDSTEHTFGDVAQTKAATCTAAGAGTQTCTVCGYVKDAVIPALGHDIVDHVCTRCGKFVPFVGPAGGYVFYDCDADNTAEDPDGADDLKSSECGWRYLEAAPGDLIEDYSYGILFGEYRKTQYGNRLFVNGTTSYSAEDCTLRTIGSGKYNTQKHVAAMEGTAYTGSPVTPTTDRYAAKLASDYSITVGETMYDDWFLPSYEELQLMYKNLKAAKLGAFGNDYYWSSSEDTDVVYESAVDFETGKGEVVQRVSTECCVRCIRSY